MMINRKFSNRDQQGFTLVELMVGLVVGLIVIGGSLAMFLSTLSNSNHALKMSKINQDLTAVMQLMVNEVRRSGYSPITTTNWVMDTASDCFIYRYWDTTAGALKTIGFRQRGNVIKVKRNPSSCGSMNTGVNLNDPNSMVVHSFVVDKSGYRCVPIDGSAVVEDCASATPPASTYVTIREIEISITVRSATYANDNIETTLTESVRVRNDLVTTI